MKTLHILKVKFMSTYWTSEITNQCNSLLNSVSNLFKVFKNIVKIQNVINFYSIWIYLKNSIFLISSLYPCRKNCPINLFKRTHEKIGQFFKEIRQFIQNFAQFDSFNQKSSNFFNADFLTHFSAVKFWYLFKFYPF